MTRFLPLFLFALFISACANVDSSENQADLLIQSGEVFLPSGKTQKLDILIQADTIVALEAPGEHFWTALKTIDASGKFIMPGFIDAHAHFMGVGMNERRVDLLATESWAEILDSIQSRVQNSEAGEWIVGRGWHQEKWTDQAIENVNGFPSNKELSALSPDNPVILVHASGHGLLANQKAMELAGIDKNTPTPEGGEILKNPDGQPIGIFQENAMNLVRSTYEKLMEKRSDEEKAQDWNLEEKLAEQVCFQNGVTSVQIAGTSLDDVRRFKKLEQKGELGVRLYCMLSEEVLRTEAESTLKEFSESLADYKFVQCRSVKGFMDGALGSRGAWMLEPYSDEPNSTGAPVTPIDTLRKSARIAHNVGFQMCIHAIGDRANRTILDIYEDVLDKEELRAVRWRSEHAQHLNPEDISRFADMGVIASMQPIHCTSDAPYVVTRLGEERAENGAYIWRTLLASGVKLAFGTDAPVERIDPLANIYAAVTRQPTSMENPFYPAESVTREEALSIYTQANAYAQFAEAEKGQISEGFLADIIILDKNLLTCEPEEILETNVLYTIVGGEVKYVLN